MQGLLTVGGEESRICRGELMCHVERGGGGYRHEGFLETEKK